MASRVSVPLAFLFQWGLTLRLLSLSEMAAMTGGAFGDGCLSPRQAECLRWVGEGKSSVDIGTLMGLSSRTVDHYVATACDRMAVRSRHQAVAVAVQRGLLEPQSFTAMTGQ
jgi:DNA-binding CsgD family transcriptional regulator